MKSANSQQIKLGEHLLEVLAKNPKKVILLSEVSNALDIKVKDLNKLLTTYFAGLEPEGRGKIKLIEGNIDNLNEDLRILKEGESHIVDSERR